MKNCDKSHATKIEITPEMIEAGALELARFTDYYETLEDGAERIFKTMLAHSYLSEMPEPESDNADLSKQKSQK